MQYYLVKYESADGVSISVFKSESDEQLQSILNLLDVPHDAEIHHIETLEYNPLGVAVIYEKEFQNENLD